MSGLLLLKYLTAALTVSIAFAGSWFFEFTKTDRKRQTLSNSRWRSGVLRRCPFPIRRSGVDCLVGLQKRN